MAGMKDQFANDGFVVIPDLLTTAQCAQLAGAVDAAPGAVGSRCLLAQPWCATLARNLRQRPELAALIPPTHVAVQCTYFEKSASRNWLVPLHQDLSIPVARKLAAPELQGWSEKEGEQFVQAPLFLLEQLVAVRVHLDPCGAADGPLRVVPGSHAGGRLPSGAREDGRSQAIEVAAGGALAMRPLLLHASSKSTGASRRRVLHFVFGPPALPYGLAWPASAA